MNELDKTEARVATAQLPSGILTIIQDETTGTGAYLITGGLSGGGLVECLKKLVPIFEKVGEFLLALALALLIVILLVGALEHRTH